jgi:shikimate dehydrogenase
MSDGGSGASRPPPAGAKAERSLFGLIGDPVAHSVSPDIYRAAFPVLGLAARYVTVPVPAEAPEGLEPAMRRLAASGGGNVTLPHKEDAALALDCWTEVVASSGACNCFWQDEAGRLSGDNTDVQGFLAAAAELPGLDLLGSRVLLLGAGGAARAVAVGCVMAGAAAIDVLNRTEAEALRLATEVDGGSTVMRVLGAVGDSVVYDLAVNATSLGLSPDDRLPLKLGGKRVHYVIDLVYGAGGTAWTRHAAGLGIPARDGLSALVHQALLAVHRWFPTLGIPVGLATVMRAAAERSLQTKRG